MATTVKVVVPHELRPWFKAMLSDLEQNKLDVALIPSPTGEGFVRVAVGSNPPWYQHLCALYGFTTKSKLNGKPKWRTSVRRLPITQGLRHILKTGTSRNSYYPDLYDIAIEYKERWERLYGPVRFKDRGTVTLIEEQEAQSYTYGNSNMDEVPF